MYLTLAPPSYTLDHVSSSRLPLPACFCQAPYLSVSPPPALSSCQGGRHVYPYTGQYQT